MTQYALNKAAGRRALAGALKSLCDPLDCITEFTEYSAYHITVNIKSLHGLSASVTLWGGRNTDGPLIAWHGAKDRMAYVKGAWGGDINQFHGCKATSFCDTPEELLEAVRIGMEAARSGKAFKSLEVTQ